MPQRIAIIDLGSNTSRLIILAYSPGTSFQLIDQVRERVRLSEGMGAENVLRLAPMDRAVLLMKVFKALCDANGIDTLIATATSAVRDARNQVEFLQRVEREAGLKLRVLSGTEEAYYGYVGAINSTPLINGLVLDIGGGSLELSRVRQRQLEHSTSLPLGAVRLSETFLRSDPIKASDVRLVNRYVEALLSSIDWLKASRGDQLVGLGGTVRAIAKMDQRRRNYPLDRLHGYVLTLPAIETLLHEMEDLPLSKREKLPGLNSDRADVIVGGALALTRLMRLGGYHDLIVCGQGLREGLFYEQFLRDQSAPLVPDVRAFSLANLTELYDVAWTHARRVEALAVSLFDQLRPLHDCGSFERALLTGAALLHDVGVAIDYYNHDEHSAYLIMNAELPGFTHREIALMALLAYYHRRGRPDVTPFKGVLTRDDEERAAKLGALLRLAEYLDRSRTQVVRSIRCRIQESVVQLVCEVRGDATTEVWATERNADLFQHVFKREVEVVTQPLKAIKAVPQSIGLEVASTTEPLWTRAQEISQLLKPRS
ncbi:MAG TPA: Ppx/GppA phosphatase family protein [Anaerolineae bacterium]|nr:Ppx/GppA phosphatase family protein [Anaerolineae bacterium]